MNAVIGGPKNGTGKTWAMVSALFIITLFILAVLIIFFPPKDTYLHYGKDGLIYADSKTFALMNNKLMEKKAHLDKGEIALGIVAKEQAGEEEQLKIERKKLEEEREQFAKNPVYVGTYKDKKLFPAITAALKKANDGKSREIVLMVDMASYGALTQQSEFRKYWDAVKDLTSAQRYKETPVLGIFLTDSKTRSVLDKQFPADEWDTEDRKKEYGKYLKEWFSNSEVRDSILLDKLRPVIDKDRMDELLTLKGIKSLGREEFFDSVLAYNNWLMNDAKKSGMDIKKSDVRFPMHMWLIDPTLKGTSAGHYSLVDFKDVTSEPLFTAPPKTAASLKQISENYRLTIDKEQKVYKRLVDAQSLIAARMIKVDRGWFHWNKNGEWMGFERKLIRAIADLIAVRWNLDPITIEDESLPWSQLLHSPAQGKPIILISTISYREAREKNYGLKFSIPYHETTLAIAAPSELLKGASIKSLLTEKKVAVQEGTTAFSLLNELKKIIDIDYKLFPDISNSVDELSKELPILIADKPVAAILKNKASTKTKKKYGLYIIKSEEIKTYLPKMPPDATNEQYVIALAEHETRALRAINDAIRALDKSGQLEKLKVEAKTEYATFHGISID